MRLIRKSRLYFQEGNSDKVYEVDLVDINSTDDNERYLVNFRYGRRGASLREGTKTPSPVSIEKAEKLFDSIVVSKTNKGYRDGVVSPSSSATASSKPESSASLLDRIRQEKNPDTRARQVWRLPPEKNPEAAALVATLLGQKDDLHEYTLLWTLGRVGSQENIDLVSPYLSHSNTTLANLALEVILALTPEEERKNRYDTLRTHNENITPDSLLNAVAQFNNADSKRATSYPIGTLLKAAYLQSLVDTDIRQALLKVLPSIPITPGAFRGVRYLLKMSEFRLDTAVFTTLNVRLEQSKPHFYRDWGMVYNEHGCLDVEEELASDTARLAHSQKTHRYLVARYSRALKRLGVSKSDRFIELAESTLLQYTAAHAKPARSTPHYRWDDNWRRQLIATLHYDEYAHCSALNTLLRANNTAYSKNRRGIWRFDPDTTFDGRGEAFPECWDKAPDSLLRIACATDCEPVSDFAIRALEDNSDFIATLSLADVIRLFTKPFTRSQAFASTRLKHLLANQPVTGDILVLLFSSGLAAPISLGLELLGQKRDFDEMLTAIAHALCIDPRVELPDHTSIIAWLEAPEQKAKFTFVDKSALLSAVLSVVSEKDFASKEHATQTFDWLLTQCQDALTNARANALPDIAVAEALIQSSSISLALFGCKLLDAMPIAYDQISEASLHTIQTSDDEDIRAFAIALLKKLTHDKLADQLDNLLGSLAQGTPAQQHATLSVFAEAMQTSSYNESNAKNQQAIVEHMVNLLHANKLEDSLQQQLLDFLRAHGNASLREETHNESLWELATARSEMAHTLTSEHFQQRTPYSRFTNEKWLALLNSPTLTLREHAQKHFGDSPDALIAQMDNIVSIMESEWHDTQDFVFDFCRESLSREQWTPDQIVAICDSVVDPVQRFGRELVQTYFDQDDAEQYLLQLSQHPAANVELFVSQLLPQHASNDETTIVALQPYFVSVLTRVNTGRPAKDNVLRFLISQANTSNAVRTMLSQLLTRLSLTSVQKDKAEYIKLMMSLKQTHGDLTLPVALKAVRHAAHHELEE
ncbi:WGR domain-containing protein [Enterovibrio norvegicus]|uniref:WGR domain-containing protein n=1 Tax=Enterovibrio norvegicus TaxID=188144 RepID=UPI000C84C68C|nr:WGR domain-containing protein [Enterovibrio norvegicus]PML81883.1 hypothetical protein BCT69_00635 [Enterovibrio norvegicus]